MMAIRRVMALALLAGAAALSGCASPPNAAQGTRPAPAFLAGLLQSVDSPETSTAYPQPPTVWPTPGVTPPPSFYPAPKRPVYPGLL